MELETIIPESEEVTSYALLHVLLNRDIGLQILEETIPSRKLGLQLLQNYLNDIYDDYIVCLGIASVSDVAVDYVKL